LPGITRLNHPHLYKHTNCLNDGELGGGNVERIDISGQAGECLLCAVGSDEGVDLDAADVVLLLEGSGNLALVGLDVDDEDEGVVLFDLLRVSLGMATATCFESYLLHGGLGVERVDEDPASIHARRMRDRLARVLGRTRELKGLGAAGC
jgi:hypothetical protein